MSFRTIAGLDGEKVTFSPLRGIGGSGVVSVLMAARLYLQRPYASDKARRVLRSWPRPMLALLPSPHIMAMGNNNFARLHCATGKLRWPAAKEGAR